MGKIIFGGRNELEIRIEIMDDDTIRDEGPDWLVYYKDTPENREKCIAHAREVIEERRYMITEDGSIVKKYWYAVTKDHYDGWDTGSYDIDEARKMAQEAANSAGYFSASVLHIDEFLHHCDREEVIERNIPARYSIKYKRRGVEHEVTRLAYSAADAIIAYCDQYYWRVCDTLVDADTYGKFWAEYSADTSCNGGADCTIVACLIK